MKKTSNDLTNKILIETVKAKDFKTNDDLNRLTILIEAIFFYKFNKKLSSNLITNTAFGPQDVVLYEELSHYADGPIDDMKDIESLNSTLLDITSDQEELLHELIITFVHIPSGTIRTITKQYFPMKEAENIPYSDEELARTGEFLINNYKNIAEKSIVSKKHVSNDSIVELIIRLVLGV